MTLKKLLAENDNPFPAGTDDFFMRMFRAFRIKALDSLTSRQMAEMGTLTESEQDMCIDIMAEKKMVQIKVVPPSHRYMVFCESCRTERPLPNKKESVEECTWCTVLKKVKK